MITDTGQGGACFEIPSEEKWRIVGVKSKLEIRPHSFVGSSFFCTKNKSLDLNHPCFVLESDWRQHLVILTLWIRLTVGCCELDTLITMSHGRKGGQVVS
jgi:hypothetical protein